ncbi:transaldolase [Campylobacter sp. RM16190]|uniref:transaldolase n=1 Tax=Campylobacter sp. RM16190 TaxID=1705727 RepID=UPI001473BE24|nr:transaldolase [Campylobacter sp. RM16190]
MFNNDVKFSLWCDFIERDFLDNEFVKLINSNTINGATSNPAIFKSAFLTSPAYKITIKENERRHEKQIYEILAVQDIKIAADRLIQNYANDDDGFVSIEVDPNLCNDTQGTIEEGVRLFNTVMMPNVMIKIPATNAGFDAMSALMSRGIPVNATLIFSPDQAIKCLDAFEIGTKEYQKKFPNTKNPKGVISIFVSRFDRLLDEVMREKCLPAGQIGIMNATKIYTIIQNRNLENVRALFASTGVKGDDLRKDYYIRELMYENSINTAPLDTIKAFTEQKSEPKEAVSEDSIEKFFEVVSRAGIDMNRVYKELLSDGLKQFLQAYDDIMKALKQE